jgi:hypothetical protein
MAELLLVSDLKLTWRTEHCEKFLVFFKRKGQREKETNIIIMKRTFMWLSFKEIQRACSNLTWCTLEIKRNFFRNLLLYFFSMKGDESMIIIR